MSNQAAIINMAGDYEETVLRLAKHLGRDKIRRGVFNIIYGRGERPRSKKQIVEILGKEGNTQTVQDALGYLHKHNLISRLENGGKLKDGSRWLYGKEPSIRALRDKIVRYADDPTAAKKVATKRRPAIKQALTLVKIADNPKIRRAGATTRAGSKARLKIALLVTNPDSRASLQTGIEARYIDEGIRLGGCAGEVDLKVVLAPTLDTMLDTLNSYQPDVLHFSGHGGGQTLIFDNIRAGDDGGTVLDFDMVARVVRATSARPKLLVLAACDTVTGADRFLETVPSVIAMSDSIDDEAACEFSGRFYRTLTSGMTILQSLEQAKLILESKGYADANLPTLLARDDASALKALL